MGSVNSRRRNKRKTKRNGEVQRSPAVSNETLDDQGSKRSLLGWGFLPCLTHEGRRWWLPSDPSTSLLLAELAITICGKELQHSNSNLRRQVRNVLQEKSSLFLYCVFHLAKEKQHESTYSLDDVAEWLEENLLDHISKGDAFLGAPKITQELFQTWSRMESYFHTLPAKQWIDHGHLWLETTGETVPKKIKQAWKKLSIDLAQDGESKGTLDSSEYSADLFLQQLSGQVRQHSILSGEFDRQVKLSKTQAVKQLAYGLSHEINNPLANISARAQQLQRDEIDPQRAASLQRISDQVYRAHEMISDLMFYANPPTCHRKEADLLAVIEEVAERYRSEATRKSIQIEIITRPSSPERTTATDLQPALRDMTPCLHIDQDMIAEAVGSLIRNAIEAISDRGAIHISIITTPDGVSIEVADSGPGLSEQAMKNAFDPYFSGREAGRGLGLGLCRVARIAELHNGSAEISGEGVGCTAKITLPY